MARAVVCRELGAPEVLRVETVCSMPLAPGNVRVAIRAAGINFPDILMVAGQYQFKPDLPFVPGMEAAGDIVEVGSDVRGISVGERVIVKLRHGGYAERVATTPEHLAPLPSTFAMRGRPFSRRPALLVVDRAGIKRARCVVMAAGRRRVRGGGRKLLAPRDRGRQREKARCGEGRPGILVLYGASVREAVKGITRAGRRRGVRPSVRGCSRTGALHAGARGSGDRSPADRVARTTV